MKSAILRALADKTRLSIFEKVSKKEICACELPTAAGTSQPAVSQHLKVLLGAKLVGVRRDGAKRLYSATGKGRRVLRDIKRW